MPSPGPLDNWGARVHCEGMAIEWNQRYGIWTACVDWVEILVLRQDGQWRVCCAAPPIKQGLGDGSLEGAQREALRLLENALWGPCKALIAARGGQSEP